jgi:hypothetical protein
VSKCPITGGSGHQHADAPHALGLLCARRKRPCRHAADERDELAPPHSITSSARASKIGGISDPMRLAVLRLITSSNFVDWTSSPNLLAAFRQGLRELGYVEGQNLFIERRYGEGREERLPQLAEELVQFGVDVIFAIGPPQALAAAKAA